MTRDEAEEVLDDIMPEWREMTDQELIDMADNPEAFKSYMLGRLDEILDLYNELDQARTQA